jgi:hypothetical protein
MAWNPFRRSTTLNDDQILAHAQQVAQQLDVQMRLMGLSSRPVTIRALGYVYGWTDAFLRTRGVDMADTTAGVPVLFHVFRRLWPEQEVRLMDRIIGQLRDDTVMASIMHGGQQYVDWRNKKVPYPTGLAQRILSGDDLDSIDIDSIAVAAK